jgi:hypothetical protein
MFFHLAGSAAECYVTDRQTGLNELDILDGIIASTNQYVEPLNVLISHIQLNKRR